MEVCLQCSGKERLTPVVIGEVSTSVSIRVPRLLGKVSYTSESFDDSENTILLFPFS
jgi:hypothetical protein